MKCPIDDNELVMAERQGIEIDYCPKCRGVWLDRGELDKIIERNSAPVARQESRPEYDDRGYGRRDYDDDDDDRRYGGGHRRKKRKSMLGDLFDFG